MGDLIAISRSKTPAVRAFLAGHSAEILFFTGVRYYRMAEMAEPHVIAKLGVPKRRRSPEQRTTAKRLREERRLAKLA